MSVNKYHKYKLNLLSNLKTLKEIADSIQMLEMCQNLDFLIKDVSNHSFRIAVVGEFKKGKSTLINALLGERVLPSDVKPTTATINRITYGIAPKAEIVYKSVNGDEPEIVKIDINTLEEYVTKLTDESRSNAEKIHEAVIYYPTKFGRSKNIDIIDTPGLNDDDEMTETTYSILPEVHTAVFIVDASFPFSETESDFLRRMIEEGVSKILYVASAIDKLDDDEIPRALSVITERISKTVTEVSKEKYPDSKKKQQELIERFDAGNIVGISALSALKANEKEDSALRVKSKFDDFENLLEEFLTEESGRVLIQTWIKNIEKAEVVINNRIKVLSAKKNKQVEEVEKHYNVNLAIAETLRRILSQEVDNQQVTLSNLLEKIRREESVLAKEISLLTESVVADYPIEGEDFLSQQNNEFHKNMGLSIEEQVSSILKDYSKSIATIIEDGFDKMQTQIVKTVISIQYLCEKIAIKADLSAEIQDKAANLADGVFNIFDIDTMNVEESLNFPQFWSLRLFRQITLPIGEFNWVNRQFQIKTFRKELRDNISTQIRIIFEELDINEKIILEIRHNFDHIKTQIENAKRFIEGFQFEFRSTNERKKTYIEQEIYSLHEKSEMVKKIVQETNSF